MGRESVEEARRRLAHKGYRLTKQRLAILKVLRGTDTHPDAEWVYREVKKVLPQVSLGTVYRSLEALREAGLIASLEVGQDIPGIKKLEGGKRLLDWGKTLC